MGRSMLERLKALRASYEVDAVCFLNDGSVKTDRKSSKAIDNLYSFDRIKDTFYDAVRVYSEKTDFDSADMQLLLGLVYSSSDVDEEYKIKENAEPMKDVVRFYTGKINSYLGDEKVNDRNFDWPSNGYISFRSLMSLIKRSGLEYTGPESFDELKERILAGETFEIKVTADLKKEKGKSLVKRAK